MRSWVGVAVAPARPDRPSAHFVTRERDVRSERSQLTAGVGFIADFCRPRTRQERRARLARFTHMTLNPRVVLLATLRGITALLTVVPTNVTGGRAP